MKAFIASMLIRLIAKSWHVEIKGRLPTGPCIVAFWHGEMLPVWFTFRALRPVALVSPSTDGALLERLVTDWGYEVVLGSSSHGGTEALQQLVKNAAHHVVLITPDGPRGPAHIMKPGAVIAAHRSGAPLVLVRMHTSWKKVFSRSWDKFELPLPFARVQICISPPIVVQAHLDRDEISAMIVDVQHELEKLGSNVC